MSFFNRKSTEKRRIQGNGSASTGKKTRLTRPPLRKENEEISSDSEIDEEPKKNGHHAGESDFEDEEASETPLQKRHRLAKEYLQQLEEEQKEKGETEDVHHDAIGHRLKEDAMEQVGRLQRKIADEWNPTEETNFRVLRGHKLSPTCLAVTSDGREIVSGSKDGAIIKWDMETGQRLHVIKGLTSKSDDKDAKGHRSVLCLAVSSDDKYLCTGGMDTNINTWDLRSMEHVKTFSGHRGRVSGLAFRRNHNQLFSCSHDRSLKIWNLDEMGYVDTMYGHLDTILDIDSLTRERAVTCGGRDRTVRMWKVPEESQLVFHAQSGCGSIECLRLINDDHFVSGADDGSLSIWSALKKKPVCVVKKAHQNWISSIATQRFTDLVASGSWDGHVKLWRCNDDYKALTLKHSLKVDGFINAMSFTPSTTALVLAVGQEHKNGRWWSKKDVKNSIVVCPLEKSQNGA